MTYQIETDEGLVIINPKARAIKGYTTKKGFRKQINTLKDVLYVEA